MYKLCCLEEPQPEKSEKPKKSGKNVNGAIWGLGGSPSCLLIETIELRDRKVLKRPKGSLKMISELFARPKGYKRPKGYRKMKTELDPSPKGYKRSKGYKKNDIGAIWGLGCILNFRLWGARGFDMPSPISSPIWSLGV